MVLDAVNRMNREAGVAVIHISHDLTELMGARTIYIMNGGRIVWEGAPSRLHGQETVLNEIGMELPPIIKLKSLMIKEGYRLNDDAVTLNEMAEEIVKIVSSKK